MSSSSIRSQLENKRSQRSDAEKRASAARSKESMKRSDATKARGSASRTNSDSSRKTYLRNADRYEDEANRAGKEVADYQRKAADFGKDIDRLEKQLATAMESERKAADKKRDQAAAEADRRRDKAIAAANTEANRLRREVASRLDEQDVTLQTLRPPKKEMLRVLVLTASGKGDLRVGREVKRIQDAVRFASGRELVELDTRPAATMHDLLNGLTQTVPHVVHFSGHGNENVVVFEDDVDAPNNGKALSGEVLSSAVNAVDERPLLVVLNACATAAQAQRLVEGGVSFAIGHSDSIGDSDAISYAARFYAAVADGQSIGAAHRIAVVDLEMSGLPGAELPQLFSANDLDADSAKLVIPE